MRRFTFARESSNHTLAAAVTCPTMSRCFAGRSGGKRRTRVSVQQVGRPCLFVFTSLSPSFRQSSRRVHPVQVADFPAMTFEPMCL